MSKFILKIILLFLPLAMLIGIMEFKAGSLPSDYGRKRLIVEKQIESAQIIVLGSSHSYYGIKTNRFDAPSLSLAYYAQDLYYDHQILFKYLSRAKNLKLAILSVSYPSLEAELQNSSTSWRTSEYVRYWDIPAQSPIPKLSDYSSIALFGIEASRNYLLFNETPAMEKFNDSGGPDYIVPVNPKLKQVPDGQVKWHESFMHSESIPKNLKYLTEMVEALQAKNVQVVLITTPCYSIYTNLINKQRYNLMQDILKDFSQKYNVEYHNYLKDQRFDENDFKDIDHLNSQGAEKFTAILKQDVNALSNLK